VEIEAVGVDLSRPGCLQVVEKVADGKNVQLLFCNAGFMISGFFADCPLGKSQANLGVNVACHLDLTHHFVNKMLAAGDRGAVFFTSSPAWMLPSPTAAMYAGELPLIMFSVWREFVYTQK
jgi:short-subunit dehydrogenase